MIEIPGEQLTTIYELAAQAVSMTRSAFGNPNSTQESEDVGVILPTSPLAAEIFKTLVRCHVQNKQQRILDDTQAQLRSNIPERGPMTGGALGYTGPRI